MQQDPFDEALETAGSLGRAQFIVIFLVAYISAYGGWQSYIPVFAAMDIDFKCVEKTASQSPDISLIDLSNFDSFENDSLFGDTCVDNCGDYVYESGLSSIVSEFDLACGSKQFLASLSNSIYWVAYLMSCFVSGFLSDKFGRKWVSFALLTILTISTVATALSPNIYVYIALRFVAGFGGLVASLDFIILAELLDKKRLPAIGMTIQVIYAVGELACTLSGYLLRDSWQWQYVAMSAPIFLYIIAHLLFMPESPRWQYSQGKIEQAEKTLRWIAKLNGRDPESIHLRRAGIDDKTINSDDDDDSSDQEHDKSGQHPLLTSSTTKMKVKSEPTVFALFFTASSSILTFCCCLKWFACSFVYYGLTYDVQNIGGDLYVNSVLLALTEPPAWFVCIAMSRYGRKNTFCLSLLISSLACFIVPFMEPVMDGDFQIAFAMIGKCLAAGAFDMLYVYSPELFPTVLRSTGLTLCSAVARVASISAPFVIELNIGPYNCLPFVLFGLSGLVCSVSWFLFGVETRGKHFLTTLDEFYSMAKTKEIRILDTDGEWKEDNIET